MVGDDIVGNSNFKAFKFFVIGYKLVFWGVNGCHSKDSLRLTKILTLNSLNRYYFGIFYP